MIDPSRLSPLGTAPALMWSSFGHVQPAAVLGGVVQLELGGQALGLGRWEGLVQGGRGVGVEVVLNQDDPLGVRIVDVDQLLDALGPVEAGAAVADHDLAPPSERLADQEQVDDALAHVLVVFFGRAPGGHRQRRRHFGEQLAAGLVQADLREPRVVRAGVDVEHVLHVPDEVGVGLGGDAPALNQPRLEPVCFKVCRTVSYETVSTTSNSTSLSASNRRVQRFWPLGGSLQATATNRASCSPSNFRRYTRSGALRCSAASSPSVTYSLRTRATVVGSTSSAVPIAPSVHSGPASPRFAFNRIRACVCARAGAAPRPISVRSDARSSSGNRTTYCFRIPGLPPRRVTPARRIPPRSLFCKSALTGH